MTSVKDRIAALQKQAQTKSGEGVLSRTPNTSWKKPANTPSHSTPINNSSYNHGRNYTPNSSPSPKIDNSRLTIPVASRLPGMNMSNTNSNTDDTNTNKHIPQSIKSRSSNKVSKLADKLKGMNVNLHPMGMPMRAGMGKPQPHQEPESGDSNNNNARGEKKSVQFRRAIIAPGQRRPRTIRRTLQGFKLSTE